MNPATIITFAAPLLIIASEAVFRSNSEEMYIHLLKTREVCGLLDHRTQMYTLIVAYFFFVIQTGEIVFRRLKTTTGTIDIRRRDPFAGWCLVILIVSVVAFSTFMLTGYFMTAEVVELYSSSRACLNGSVGTTQIPPMSSPITIFRGLTGVAAATISYLDLKNA